VTVYVAKKNKISDSCVNILHLLAAIARSGQLLEFLDRLLYTSDQLLNWIWHSTKPPRTLHAATDF